MRPYHLPTKQIIMLSVNSGDNEINNRVRQLDLSIVALRALR
jgi:hypothetical protein